jgi:hypothetical protein
MSFARNILRDLVEKRLWPVALLLVVAIVAIPVVGGGMSSSKGSSDESLPAAPDAATNASTAVELLGPPAVRKRPGKLVDPFRRSAKKKDADATAAAPTTTAKTGGATAPDASSTAPTTDTTPAAPKPSLSVYRTTVRWGSGDGVATARPIARLTPFGNDVLNPAVQYLGVSPGGKRALFLLGPDAKSAGDAGCRESSCRLISLRAGDTQIVDLTPDDAVPSQFELEVVSVKRHAYSSAAKAAAARAKVHSDGRDVLQLLLEDDKTAAAMTGFAYDRHLGVIVKSASTPVPAGT